MHACPQVLLVARRRCHERAAPQLAARERRRAAVAAQRRGGVGRRRGAGAGGPAVQRLVALVRGAGRRRRGVKSCWDEQKVVNRQPCWAGCMRARVLCSATRGATAACKHRNRLLWSCVAAENGRGSAEPLRQRMRGGVTRGAARRAGARYVANRRTAPPQRRHWQQRVQKSSRCAVCRSAPTHSRDSRLNRGNVP